MANKHCSTMTILAIRTEMQSHDGLTEILVITGKTTQNKDNFYLRQTELISGFSQLKKDKIKIIYL
jgi:hypothetical protein